MIWLTWRQHRKQLMFTVAALAVLAAVMIPTGLAMRHAFDSYGLPACLRQAQADLVSQGTAGCNSAVNRFRSQYNSFSTLGVLFLLLPAFMGLFWGAPLVAREVEYGTHRLVWTQSVSRQRWALVKFGLVGCVTLLVAVFYGLGMSWWLAPMSQATHARLTVFFFDMQGVVPVGYTVFAVALGVLAGALWHKVLPAMAVTLVSFVGVRVLVTALARPHYISPRTLTFPIRGNGLEPNEARGDWVLASGIRNASGRMLMENAQMVCPPDATGPGAACGADLNVGAGGYNWELYQPGSRYWPFQWIETGIFVALAAAMIYVAMRRIRRIA